MTVEYCDFAQLNPEEQNLLQAAQTVMHNAYNVYSDFLIGAAVQTRSGSVYRGTFMENASQGLSVCAEVAAILAATAAGELDIHTIAVVGGPKMESSDRIITPCGRCRQVIYEVSQIAQFDIRVICSNKDLTHILRTTISYLLPLPFGPADVGALEKAMSFAVAPILNACESNKGESQ